MCGCNTMKSNIYQKSYEVHYYETNFRLEATPNTILGYLEETATCHSETVGNNINLLSSSGLGWVVYRYNLQMSRYPYWQEKITITTWVEKFRRCFAYRNFYIYDSKDNLIGQAASIWILIDLKQKKPVRIPEKMVALYGTYPKTFPEVFSELPKLETSSFIKEFKVGPTDIDINFHTNHKKYITWLLETIPFEVQKQAFPASIEITYRKESTCNDHIQSQCQELDKVHNRKCFLHYITCPEKEADLVIARTTWENSSDSNLPRPFLLHSQ
ncbi:MAG: hypothetical protein PWP31_1802 [Clostridia bacterium]|nr:hypothetical protein [Clostridia bacterium]